MFTTPVKRLARFVLVAGLLTAAYGVPAQDEAQQPSLYDRLGGLMPISVVVGDFIDVVVADDSLNQNPAVDAARQVVPAAYLKYQVTAQVCQATGGPCQYQGRDMKSAHAHLGITPGEWERMLVLFAQVLDKHQVPEAEQGELVAIVESTRADIVTRSE